MKMGSTFQQTLFHILTTEGWKQHTAQCRKDVGTLSKSGENISSRIVFLHTHTGLHLLDDTVCGHSKHFPHLFGRRSI